MRSLLFPFCLSSVAFVFSSIAFLSEIRFYFILVFSLLGLHFRYRTDSGDIVLQEPLVKFFLVEVEHLASRLIVRHLLGCRQLVEKTFRYTHIDTGFAEGQHLLCRVDVVFKH